MKGAKARAKVNRRAREDTPREHGYNGGYHHNNSGQKGGGKFVNVCDLKIVCTSTAARVLETS